MPRPKEWGDQYLFNYLYDEVESMKAREGTTNLYQLKEAIEFLTSRVGELEAELIRLDLTKANKRGPKPKNS